ncbi:hypothetical protein BH09BAC6_BH09BAC6_29960 [soil metagenome]
MKSLLLTVCVSFLLVAGYAQKNLVINGGFEDELFGWNENGARVTPWNIKSGKSSCAIVTTNTDKWVGIDQVLSIPKKAHSVEFSAWLKTINVVKGKDDWNGALFTVVFLDVRDKEMSPGVNIASITGDREWQLSKKTITMPEKAASFKILLAMGFASGTMLVDDGTAKVVD